MHSKLRIIGIVIIAAFFATALFADFLAPNDYRDQVRREPSAPISSINFRRPDGTFSLRPFVKERRLTDVRSFAYEEVADSVHPIEFFNQGSEYSFLGLFRTNRHLLGVARDSDTAPRLTLLGTDQLGRDRFSRLLHAIRFSFIVSPLGAFLACLIGIIYGSVSGYAPGSVDSVMMGAADVMISLPSLILILAARAAFPLELPPLSAGIMMVSVFALTGWAEMARLTCGLIWSMKDRDFVLAARASGLTEPRILVRHIAPNIAPPLIVQATLIVPVFLLSEAALSFFGIGLQEPEPSLGNMLAPAADLSQLANSPFILLAPAFAILIFVLGVRLAVYTKPVGGA
jgi:peptide/nickel transport system permease protein